MKLTITGSGSGKPSAGKNHSSILLEEDNHVILLDCGEPAARIIARRFADPDAIDAVVITHFHPDHSSGIFMLLQLFHILKRKKELKVFLPENIAMFKETLKMFYLFDEKFSFKLNLILVSQLTTYFNWMIPLKNNHLKQYKKLIAANKTSNEMLSYSIFIKAEKNLLYTADISSINIFSEILPDTDIVILDALHPQIKEIMQLIDTGKLIYLNHGLNPGIDREMIELNYKNTIIAEDGIEIFT